MPTSITSSSGTVYHLWQLHDLCAPQPQDSISFTIIENEMPQGYRSSALLGLNTGLREWTLTLPTISIYGGVVTDPYGASVTREQYIRNLFKYNQTTGIPFAYIHDSQYYLVDFANSDLAMAKKRGVNIYSTTIQLRERRINGQTIFQVPDVYWFYEATHNSPDVGDWGNAGTPGQYLTSFGGVTFGANPQNGFNTVRLDGTSGYLTQTFSNVLDIVVVLKVRSATFANAAGLFSGASNIIRGTSGGTKWQNPSLTGFEYLLNGQAYAVTDMQAPMNAFGVCQFGFATPVSITVVGRDTATAYLAADLAELIINDGSVSRDVMREIALHQKIKWGVL